MHPVGRLIPSVFVLLGYATAVTGAEAAEVRIGVAANFVATLEQMAGPFERRYGHRMVISSGSTGKLYAQISNGAPYDLFLAADRARPERLEAEGEGVPGTRFTYALGRIVLWSKQPHQQGDSSAVLTRGQFRRLAIANPLTAPYGLAAQQVMQQLGVWELLQPKLVRGENIAQTFQFVASGNAELGFIAPAQLRARGEPIGTAWEIPAKLHRPIEQQALLLRGARQPQAAQAFLTFLRSDEVHGILQRFGYDVPPVETAE
mgnify:CR=1 FL=1